MCMGKGRPHVVGCAGTCNIPSAFQQLWGSSQPSVSHAHNMVLLLEGNPDVVTGLMETQTSPYKGHCEESLTV